MKKSFAIFNRVILATSMLLFMFCICSPASAKSNKPIILKFATYHNPASPSAVPWKIWAEEVESRSNGRVHIKFYWAQSLVTARDMYKSVLKGVCDIGLVTQMLAAHAFPLNSVVELPLMGFKDSAEATAIRWRLIKKYPEMAAEFKGTKLLWQVVALPTVLFNKKLVKIPKDIKHMKIIVPGSLVMAFAELGASPINIPPPEFYMSLERGVAEGSAIANFPFIEMKLNDHLKYRNNMVISYNCSQRLMNIDTWNSLPKDIQNIIEEESGRINPIEVEQYAKIDKGALEAMLKSGQKLYTPTPEEEKLWVDKLKPVHKKWIEEIESKGLPGRAVYNEAKRLMQSGQ